MKIKVCGNREIGNIKKIEALRPDFMGFIFYEKSKRFVNDLDKNIISELKAKGINPVAVTVNADLEYNFELNEKYGFEYFQLHGTECPEHCRILQNRGFKVIKTFSVEKREDVIRTMAYAENCDYYLFDTKTKEYGGSGKSYDWNILSKYFGDTPFFLSGGIGPDDVDKIQSFSHPKFIGVDVNSKFEISAVVKDADLLKKFIEKIRK